MDYQQISAAIRKEIQEAHEDTFEAHITRSRPLNPESQLDELSLVNYHLDEYADDLKGYNRVPTERERAKRIFDSLDLEYDERDPAFLRACHDLSAGMIDVLNYHRRLLNGITSSPHSQPVVIPKNNTEKPKGLTIRERFEDFLSDRKKSQGIGENAIKNYRDAVDALVFIVGDIQAADVNYDLATTVRDTLLELPTHRNKRKIYRGKTLGELMDMEIPEEHLISGSTVKQRLENLRTYFKWMFSRELIDRNPFEGVTCKGDKESWDLFTREDLNTIFNSDLYDPDSTYAQRTSTTASHWWIPLILLYTGMRPGELLQLRPCDVIETDQGVMAFSLTDELKLKTKNAMRDIPLHPQLIDLGFREYVSEVKRRGHDRLISGFSLGSARPANQVTRWFNSNYLRNYVSGIYEQPKKRLYSFRHTFHTQGISVANIAPERVQQMTGHAQKGLGATRFYNKGLTVDALYGELSKIEFDGLDLGQLKDGWKRFSRL